MSVFILETEAVSSAASTINSLASQVSNLSSAVSGYDTSCEDDFDFASAKSVIAENIEACSTKMKNTSNIMESVVNSHTQLQNSLTFSYETEETTNTSANGNSSTNYSRSSYSGGYSGGGYSGGSYSGGSYTGNSYFGNNNASSADVNPGLVGGVAGSTVVAPMVPGVVSDSENTKEPTSPSSTTKPNIEKVGYAYVDGEKLSSASKKIFTHDDFEYGSDGYAKIGDRYVIACDSSVGEVGDVIRITKNDGTVVECVVGVNTKSDKYQNSINFVIDKEKIDSLEVHDDVKNLLNNNKDIENCGSYETMQEEAIVTVQPNEGSTGMEDLSSSNGTSNSESAPTGNVENNTTTVPDETGTVGDNTTTVPNETGTVGDGTTTVPNETGTVGDGTTTVPNETGTVEDGTTTVPNETGTVGDGTTTVPNETGTVEDGTTTIPTDTNTDNVDTSDRTHNVVEEDVFAMRGTTEGEGV